MLDNRNVLRTLLWDPLESVATRPLALVQDNVLYCYGVGFNKNVTEVFDGQGATAVAYDYSPYGTVGRTGSLVQPVQWSSEMNDEELALVYYNYRHYNSADGRWISRDLLSEFNVNNLCGFVQNKPISNIDYLGNEDMQPCPEGTKTRPKGNCREYKTAEQNPDNPIEVNGCGSKNGYSWPDTYFDGAVNFKPACDAHDSCYGTCGSKKENCDTQFYSDLKRACLYGMSGYGKDLFMLPVCNSLAWSYYQAVNWRGRKAYEDAQNELCLWKPCL